MAPATQGPKPCPLQSRKFVGPDVRVGTHDILFIGWNPGDHEERELRPFVGPSGKLLKGWIRRMGLTGRVGFSNACFHRPAGGNREPTKEEVLGCWPINQRLIQSMKPKLIVCLGAPAARMLGFKGSLGGMVGRFKIYGSGDSATLVTVLYHPAYAIRQKGSKRFAELEAQAFEVVQEAVYRVSGDRQVENYPRVHVDVVLLQGTLNAIDCEHHGGVRADGSIDPRLVTLDSVQAYNGSGPVVIGPSLLASPRQPLLFHNAIHDLIVLSLHGSTQERVVGDTMVAAWMLGRQNLSLKGLAWRELDARVLDFNEVTDETRDNYDAQDPVLTWRLHAKLYRELQDKGVAWLYDNVEMPLQPILCESTVMGLEIDQEKLRSLWGAMERRVHMLEERMAALVGPDFNPQSPAQVLKALQDRGLRVKNTDSTTLSKYMADQLVQLVLAHRVAVKRIGTYYRPMSIMKILSGIWKPTGAETGRLSQVDKNLTNLPPDVKGCVKARDGYMFVYRDYSQIEVRVAGYLSRDEYLLTALKEGRNIHEELCVSVFGYRVPELYTRSKSANFERLYAGSLATRAEKMGVSESRMAKAEIPWPGFEKWAERQREEARRTGVARDWMGRMMVLHGVDSSDKYIREKAERQAINMPEQGGATSVVKYAMVKAQPLMKQLGGRVAHQEHDSILCEVPTPRVHEADAALDQAMTEAVPEEARAVIDFPSKSVISTHWG